MFVETESRQVRRARKHRAARPRRYFETSQFGNRAVRRARRDPDATSPSAVHPTKGRPPPSARRQCAQLAMVLLFRRAAARLEQRRAAA